MQFSVIDQNTDPSRAEAAMFKDGLLVPLPASELAKIPQPELSLACNRHGVYQIPSTELIEYLRGEMGDPSKAMEVGAGNGCIGRALGIRMTDNWLQTRPDIKAYYEMIGQVTVKYGEDVEKIEALEAFEKYKPEVVIGCWITERVKGGVTIGHVEGVREMEMFERGLKKYIHVGNNKTHGPKLKRMLDNDLGITCKAFTIDWLFSRSMSKSENSIYIFEKP